MDIKLLVAKQKLYAKKLFQDNPEVFCPYFEQYITFNSDGLHHLSYSGRRRRSEKEQLFKLSALPFVFNILKKSGTVQEYRLINGINYWAFIALCKFQDNNYAKKVKVIIRQMGNGKIVFLSVVFLKK